MAKIVIYKLAIITNSEYTNHGANPHTNNMSKQKQTECHRKEFYLIERPSSEDCLYLNVITPTESPGEKLPVALWIYGGGFAQGYSQKLETGGEAFAQHGVVYVSFNYHVGVFGYTSCPALDAETEEGL